MNNGTVLKVFVSMIFMAATLSCNKNTSEHTSVRLDDLAGTWMRTMQDSTKIAFEIWNKVDDGLNGVGVVLNNDDTVFKEQLRIFNDSGVLYYGAYVPENQSEILFKHTGVQDGYYVFENPDHDFPKVIKYQWSTTELNVSVGDDSKKLHFNFEKAGIN